MSTKKHRKPSLSVDFVTDLTFNRALLRLNAFSRIFAKLAACSVLKVGVRTLFGDVIIHASFSVSVSKATTLLSERDPHLTYTTNAS
jgi:hypothetical protein